MKMIIEDNAHGARIRVWDGSTKPAIDVKVAARVAVAAIQAVQGIVKKELAQ